MRLINYFKNEFWKDIKQIDLFRPNEVILQNPEEFFLHKEVRFFGGRDWENYSNDITKIEKKEEFILSLFIISTIDYFIKNNIELYSTIKQKYDPPKLGWCGYGPHFEHPFKIYQIIKNNHNNSMSKRNIEILQLFNQIIQEHEGLNINNFKQIIINNIYNIPERFNDPVFFIFLNNEQQKSWTEEITSILTE